MKQIKLTQGQYALVDDEDFEYLNQWKWYADKIGNTYYVKRRCRILGGKGKTKYMHRDILNKNADGRNVNIIDHIDGDGLNNCKSNLRECDKKGNMHNTAAHLDGSSKYKGVSWSKTRNKWQVNICHNYKVRYIGRYVKEEDAAIAYNEAASKFHGEFAKLNIL